MTAYQSGSTSHVSELVVEIVWVSKTKQYIDHAQHLRELLSHLWDNIYPCDGDGVPTSEDHGVATNNTFITVNPYCARRKLNQHVRPSFLTVPSLVVTNSGGHAYIPDCNARMECLVLLWTSSYLGVVMTIYRGD